jgi:IS5 family transposase
MKQLSLNSSAPSGFERKTKQTRKAQFLQEMELIVPWAELVALIKPHVAQPSPKGGRPPFGIETMLRIHFMQQWFTLSDQGMEEALYDVPLYQRFAAIDTGEQTLPDETTILRFRHLLEANQIADQILATVNANLAAKGLLLKSGTIVDATLIAAPSNTKNASGQRDPEMHSTQKGKQMHFGMKAHIGVDAESGLVHTVVCTSANAHDVTQVANLLHGQEADVFGDSGYRGADKRSQVQEQHGDVNWHVSMMPSKRKALDKDSEWGKLMNEAEKCKSKIRAKVEHAFRTLKCQFGYRKVKYKGLAKNTANVVTLFALGNLWRVRHVLLKQMDSQRGWCA